MTRNNQIDKDVLSWVLNDLFFATIIQTIRDAAGNPKAKELKTWLTEGSHTNDLHEGDCKTFCEENGINFELINSWVDMGCSRKPLYEFVIEQLTKQYEDHKEGKRQTLGVMHGLKTNQARAGARYDRV